jgi:hypothetical protein
VAPAAVSASSASTDNGLLEGDPFSLPNT